MALSTTDSILSLLFFLFFIFFFFKSSKVSRTTIAEPRGTSKHQRKDIAEPIEGEESGIEESRSFCRHLSMHRPGEGPWVNMA